MEPSQESETQIKPIKFLQGGNEMKKKTITKIGALFLAGAMAL